MKKIIFCLLLMAVSSHVSSSNDRLTAAGKKFVSYFFTYDATDQLIYPSSLPPTVLPYIPYGPLERPYYAEYSDYYLNTTTSPWRYEPDGVFLGDYYGPVE